MIVTGNVSFEGINLHESNPESLKKIRSSEIRYIFQEPAQSLNPVATIRSQFRRATAVLPDKLTEEGSFEILYQAGIQDPARVLRAYLHQLSVGTIQRVLIAMALATKPKLLIADEPTSSVDALLRLQILGLLDSVRRESRMAVLLITHDLEVARRYADRIAVLYAGRIAESSDTEDFFCNPRHPYSKLLMNSQITFGKRLEDIPTVNGSTPGMGEPLPGCKFGPRCHKLCGDCLKSEPELIDVGHDRKVRCHCWK